MIAAWMGSMCVAAPALKAAEQQRRQRQQSGVCAHPASCPVLPAGDAVHR